MFPLRESFYSNLQVDYISSHCVASSYISIWRSPSPSILYIIQAPGYSGHDCYTGDRSSIPTHDDSLIQWMNLRPGQPMLCEGNWVVNPRCWWDINLHSVYNCKNGLLSLLQFNHIQCRIQRIFVTGMPVWAPKLTTT